MDMKIGVSVSARDFDRSRATYSLPEDMTLPYLYCGVRTRKSPGFTITELMIVVVLLSITAMVSLPAAEPSQVYKLDLAVSRVANGIRFARGEALRTTSPYGVELDASLETVRVYRGDRITSPPTPIFDVYHPVTRKLYAFDIGNESPTRGVTYSISATWSGACNSFLLLGFDVLGTPRCGDPWSTSLITHAIALTLGGHTRTVIVHGTTGRVTIQ